VVLGVALLALASCGTTVERWDSNWSALSPAVQQPLASARAALEAGDVARAWAVLDAATRAEPDNLDLAVLLQDVELEVMARGLDVHPLLTLLAKEPVPEEELRKAYAARAEERPSATSFVLAARIESDALAAENFIERALEIDDSNAWAYYGRAHALLLQEDLPDRWEQARAALDTALRLDPGHLRARRLDSWMEVQQGATEATTLALQVWLNESRDDPRISSAERDEAVLDLAISCIVTGEPGYARDLLLSLEGKSIVRSKRLALLAAAEQATGDLLAALDAARRAEAADRSSILPTVQKAMLYDFWLEDSERARDEWQAVIDRAGDNTELGALLQLLRAQVRLERSAAEAAQSQGEDAP